MADPSPRISERLAIFRNELPVITPGVKGEFQYSERLSIPDFTVGLGCSDGPVRVFSAGASHELTNAVLPVRLSVRVLRCKTLVIMIVPVYDDLGSSLIKQIPQGLHQRIVSVSAPRTKQRLVKIRQRAARWMLRQVLLQPFSLRRRGLTPAHMRAFAVQSEDVPRPKFIAVISLRWISRRIAKVLVVSGGTCAVVFMISGSRASAVFETTPCGFVAFGKVFIGSPGISEIAGNENPSGYFVNQLRCGIGACQIFAAGDVSRPNQDRITRCNSERGRGRFCPLAMEPPTMLRSVTMKRTAYFVIVVRQFDCSKRT